MDTTKKVRVNAGPGGVVNLGELRELIAELGSGRVDDSAEVTIGITMKGKLKWIEAKA